MDIACDLLLLAEDSLVRATLAHELVVDGYTVHVADPARLSARSLPRRVWLVLLAWPQRERALGLLRRLRGGELAPPLDPGTRVLWLCATRETDEVLCAFGGGADDVLRRPWAYAELCARIRALAGRRDPQPAAVLRCGALEVDTSLRSVCFAGTPVALRRLEYELLCYLVERQGQVCSKRELLRQVWGYRAAGRTRTVDSHACRLRGALQRAGAPPQIILTIWGVGYRLCAVEPAGPRIPTGERKTQPQPPAGPRRQRA